MSKVSKREKIFYVVVGFVLVVSLSLLMTVRVQSRSREATLFDNRYYGVAEESYKKEVQQVLENYDCCNSGLTMTRVVSMDGGREYKLQIHNRKLQNLSAEVYEALCDEVEKKVISLPDGTNYSVEVWFEK